VVLTVGLEAVLLQFLDCFRLPKYKVSCTPWASWSFYSAPLGYCHHMNHNLAIVIIAWWCQQHFSQHVLVYTEWNCV